MSLYTKIVEILNEEDVSFKERPRTLHVQCPVCNKDKFSILKENGACVCYRASCNFGKKWFHDWIAVVANISVEEAKRRLYSTSTPVKAKIDLLAKVKEQIHKPSEDNINPVNWPLSNLMELSFFDGSLTDGAKYLQNRGIPASIAKQYDILYSEQKRRVFIPIKYDNQCYGYQARSIDKVEDHLRMLNNEGFRRDSLVMFLDRIDTRLDHLIICEGPFDAIKFHNCKNAVATLGKIVTPKQITLMLRHKPSKIYLGLDDDAFKEMTELTKTISGVDFFLLKIPQSCKDRCQKIGKKADFGECSFEEAQEAFENAIKLNKYSIIL